MSPPCASNKPTAKGIKKGFLFAIYIKNMSKPHTIEFVKNIAKNKGGECLSFLYKNQYQKLDFLCKNKHKFEGMANIY
jgi:hypothetical protein